jgi:ribosomal protein S18 acetylase RimI-like enzyme
VTAPARPQHATIREGSRADAPLLARWMIAMAWETERKRLDSDVISRGVEAVFDEPARGRYFVAECEGEVGPAVAGMLMLTHEWSDWRCGDWWWIQSVYVAPEFRRRRVYRALHAHVRALAEATPGVCGLRLYVEKENAEAQRTYASLGMRDAGYLVFEDEFEHS